MSGFGNDYLSFPNVCVLFYLIKSSVCARVCVCVNSPLQQMLYLFLFFSVTHKYSCQVSEQALTEQFKLLKQDIKSLNEVLKKAFSIKALMVLK